MLPNKYSAAENGYSMFRTDGMEGVPGEPTIEMRNVDTPVWEQSHQDVDVLGSGIFQAQNLQPECVSDGLNHMQALRSFGQGSSSQNSMLLGLGEDTNPQFRPLVPEFRSLCQSEIFGTERTPHRTQFQRESHILAERQRREEMNDKFSALRAMLPKTTKKDKASIVGDTITYVRELERTLKCLQASKACKKSTYIPPKITQITEESNASSERQPEGSVQITPSEMSSSDQDSPNKKATQVEVHNLGEQAVVKVLCSKTPRLILRVLTALDECKVDILQSNVTTVGDNAIHYFTIELNPGVSAATDRLVAALEMAASNPN